MGVDMRTSMLLAVALTLATGCASRAQPRSGHDAEQGAAQDVAGWLSGLAADTSRAVANSAQVAADATAEVSGELAAGADEASRAAAQAAAAATDAGARGFEAAATASRDVANAVGAKVDEAEADAPRLQLVVETGSCPGGPDC